MKLRKRIQRFFEPSVVGKIGRLISLGEEFNLPDRDVKNAQEMLDANELEVSFDTIVTQLYEYEIPVTDGFISLSEEIMDEMKIVRSEYDFIYKLAIQNAKK